MLGVGVCVAVDVCVGVCDGVVVGVCDGVGVGVCVWVAVNVGTIGGNAPLFTNTTLERYDGAIEYVPSINQMFFVWFGFNSIWYSHIESSHLL